MISQNFDKKLAAASLRALTPLMPLKPLGRPPLVIPNPVRGEELFFFHANWFWHRFVDVEFVDEVGGSVHLVDDEEHVTDVDVDSALEFRLEVDVAAHGFPVSVESETDEFALAVHDRAA